MFLTCRTLTFNRLDSSSLEMDGLDFIRLMSESCTFWYTQVCGYLYIVEGHEKNIEFLEYLYLSYCNWCTDYSCIIFLLLSIEYIHCISSMKCDYLRYDFQPYRLYVMFKWQHSTTHISSCGKNLTY